MFFRSKSWQGKQQHHHTSQQAASAAAGNGGGETPSNFVSRRTASVLIGAGIADQCLDILKSLLTYWKSKANEDSCAVKVGSTLLKVSFIRGIAFC